MFCFVKPTQKLECPDPVLWIDLAAHPQGVCERPRGDVMPAIAAPILIVGSSITFTPLAKCVSHSSWRTARKAEWQPTSDAEHAVSNDVHGPCSPSTNDTRPEAIARLSLLLK